MIGLSQLGRTRVVTERIPGLSVCAVNVLYPVGGATHWVGPGVAHLLEHILEHQGTGDFPGRRGAATHRETTSYWAVGPSHRITDLLDRQGERQRPFDIPPAILSRHRLTVLQELRQRQAKERVTAQERLLKAAFGSHGYARSITGSSAEIGAIRDEELIEAHRIGYRGPTLIAIISPLTAAEILKRLSERGLFLPESAAEPEAPPVPACYQSGSLRAESGERLAFFPAPCHDASEQEWLPLLQSIWQRRLGATGGRVMLTAYGAAGSCIITELSREIAATRELLAQACTESEISLARSLLRAQRQEAQEDLSRRLMRLTECGTTGSFDRLAEDWPGEPDPQVLNQIAERLLQSPPLLLSAGAPLSLQPQPWPFAPPKPSRKPGPPPSPRLPEATGSTLLPALITRAGRRFLAQAGWELTRRQHLQIRIDGSALPEPRLYGLYERFRGQKGVRRLQFAGRHLLVAWAPALSVPAALALTDSLLRTPGEASEALLRSAVNGGEYLRLYLPSVLAQLGCPEATGPGEAVPVGAAVLGDLTQANRQLLHQWLERSGNPQGLSLEQTGPACPPGLRPAALPGLREIDLYLYSLPGADPLLFPLSAAAKAVHRLNGSSLEEDLQWTGSVYSLSSGVAMGYGCSFLWFGLFPTAKASPAGVGERIQDWVQRTYHHLQDGGPAIDPITSDEALDRLDQLGWAEVTPRAHLTFDALPLFIPIRQTPSSRKG